MKLLGDKKIIAGYQKSRQKNPNSKGDLRAKESSASDSDSSVAAEIDVASNTCRTCNQTFPEKTRLLVHISTVHDNQNQYACDKCDFTFAQKGHFL